MCASSARRRSPSRSSARCRCRNFAERSNAGKALDQPEGRAKALFDAKPLLQALPANALRAQIMHMFADRLDIPFEEVAALSDVDTRIAAPPRRAPRAASGAA